MVKLTRYMIGAAAGYLAYCLVVLCSVLLKVARFHYFDKESLLYGAIAPIGALGAYAQKNFGSYPGWLNFRNLLAYVLVILGAVLVPRLMGPAPEPRMSLSAWCDDTPCASLAITGLIVSMRFSFAQGEDRPSLVPLREPNTSPQWDTHIGRYMLCVQRWNLDVLDHFYNLGHIALSEYLFSYQVHCILAGMRSYTTAQIQRVWLAQRRKLNPVTR